MNVQIVIQRELRVASRKRETWILRLAFGIGTLGAFGFGMLLPHVSPRERGQIVLLSLAICSFVLSLCAGPYLTSDAVSCEKRAGTLGLLFLTPLAGWEIILGKMLTHSLQVGYALLSGFAFFFLPHLLGGVVWDEVLRLLLVLVLTLLLSLSSGLFWSTVVNEARTAVLATVVALLLLVFVPWLGAFIQILLSRPGGRTALLPLLSPMTPLMFAFESAFRSPSNAALGHSGAFQYWAGVGCSLASSLGLLLLSGWLLPRVWTWREATAPAAGPVPAPQSAAAAPSDLMGRQPIGARPLHWLTTRKLREPHWWQHLRIIALLFFGSMLIVAVSTRHWKEGFIAAFCTAYALHFATRVQIALTATRGWQEDRFSGALETLLATPVTDADLLTAHHYAIAQAFRMPLKILFGVNAALETVVLVFPNQLNLGPNESVIFSVFFIGGALVTAADFAALRWLCLREALCRPNHLRAASSAFCWLVAWAWVSFAVAWLLALRGRVAEVTATVFASWLLLCLIYDGVLIHWCWKWMRPGFRQRAAEG